MNTINWLIRRLSRRLARWPRRLQRIGQVCEMALVNVELFCKVRARRVTDPGTAGPLLLLQLETETEIPQDVMHDLRCYLARKMNEVLGTRITLEDFALTVIPMDRDTGPHIPYVPSRMLAMRLAPLMLGDSQQRGQLSANDSRLSAVRSANDSQPESAVAVPQDFDGRLATRPMG